MRALHTHRSLATALLTACTGAALSASLTAAPTAADILETAGVKGGIIVHLGCDDGRLTAALRANESYTVHGLDTSQANVAKARRLLHSRGLYGPVAVEQFDGRTLPYADNLVNLIVVASAECHVAKEEIARVLAPRGVAIGPDGASCIPHPVSRTRGGLVTYTKPVPGNIDEWSHYLHDAGNSAVAKDTLVGPPRRLQWVAPPLWLRSHETPSGIQAQIAAGGRLFYIFDEGLIGITDERLPAKWSIVCRDAFNGKLLWKRPLPRWGWREWAQDRLKGKDWTTVRALRTVVPGENQRRLVADGERLYATLGYRAPLSILDAATGEVLATVEGTDSTAEILLSDGIVLSHVLTKGQKPANSKKKVPVGHSLLVAADCRTGNVLWKQDSTGAIRSLQLAIDGGKVLFQTGNALAALDLKTGKRLWEVKPKTRGINLVAAEGVVLLLGGTSLESYDAGNGKKLWQNKIPKRSGGETPDLFVADGTAWPGMIPVSKDLKAIGKSERAMALGFDIRTGRQLKRIVVGNFRSPEHHHRCYRNKATTRFIISGMEGAEFLDLQGEGHSQNNWLRGACKHGIMPCNGLLYVPPDQCFCQPGGKVLGYTAVAADSESRRPDVEASKRLEKGSAYGVAIRQSAAGNRHSDDWPTFRHNAARSGGTAATVPARTGTLWHTKLSGKLTQPVAASGKVLVAAIDAHTVHALDATSGKPLWAYTAGGRIDSPPTLHNGLALFGSRDGYVYCVRLSDGVLVWRFLAAPHDRRLAGFDQVESAWPVHGSILVMDGVAYAAAGRSTYLDGGMRFYGLDPATGRVVHKGMIEGPHPDLKKPRDVAFYVRGANSDVLVAEGGHIYMRQKKLTPDLKEIKPGILSSKGEADVGLHVFSTAGLLDDSWYNRAFWMYSKRWPGFQLANQSPKSGQLLVHDEKKTFAVRAFYRRNVHSPMFFPGREGYLLFADRNTNEPQIVGEEGARKPLEWLPQSDYSRGRGGEVRRLDSNAFGGDKGIGYTRAKPPLWKTWLKVRIRAMVKTRDTVFIAGPPDVLDPKDPFATFEGRRGGVLVSVSAADGEKLHEQKLDAEPVFDGMSATPGRLFISLRDGSVACMGE
jgi:outer membrane protein assembly factor BamB